MSRRGAAAIVAALVVGAAARADLLPVAGPPGPLLPRREARFAVVLEDGWLLRAPGDETDRQPLARGAVLPYDGEQRDAFGRTWHRLGAQDAWLKRQRWYAVVQEVADRLTGPAALLTALPPPVEPAADPAAATSVPAEGIGVPADWWRSSERVELTLPPEAGELAGVRAWSLPPEVLEEARTLPGGSLAWPADRPDSGLGTLRLLGPSMLVSFWDGDSWSAGSRPRVLRPVWGLLRNPELVADVKGPREQTGPHVPCWRLVGALDPRGMAVGRVDVAPVPVVAPTASAARPEERRYLGLRDLAPVWNTPGLAATVVPRPVKPESEARGVLLDDSSARQAVYLEQRLEGEIVRALAGRTLRLAALVRAAPTGEGVASGTAAVQVLAGGQSASASANVAATATTVETTLAVPPEADAIVVRLLPNDPSIAVQERGRMIFERVSLAPVEWPSRLEPTWLLLRRVRVTGYEPARRYTRARLVVTQRGPEELRRVWSHLTRTALPPEQQEAVLRGELLAGMSTEAVTLAWGEPAETDLAGGLRRWRWPERSATFDDDGRLIAWAERSTALPPLSACGGSEDDER